MSAFNQLLTEHAQQLGFSMLGITPAKPSPHLDAYRRWLDAGMHGTMAYLSRPDRLARRAELNVILPGARSLIVVTQDYHTLSLPPEITTSPFRGLLSNYAWGADYHRVMLPRLETLADFLRGKTGGKITARAYVDTGAILERSHAQQAGLGFLGKNTMLIHPRRGSFFFLGEIITNLELERDAGQIESMPTCGTCTRCLSACPTNAFPAPHVLDARRCISYLTIEHKEFIPHHLRPLMGRWVYGCDVCQEVCPWQRFARPASLEAFRLQDYDRSAPPLPTLLALDENQFADQFRGTAIFRIRRERLVRNACIAAGNSGLPDLARWLTPLLGDRSALVRGHAAWALGELGVAHDALRAALARETNSTVRSEIEVALTDGPE